MLKEAWEAAGSPRHAQVAEGLEIATGMLQGWVAGRTVPTSARTRDFRAVVRKWRHASGSSAYSDVEWEAALLAARDEARNAQGGQILANRRRANPGLRFVRLHRSAPDTSAVEVRGRTDERTEMNAFVRDPRAEAPSYLCWHADAPVGKTVLLADYVRRQPPADADILTFFVSAAHGTDTRAAFEEEIVDQIDDFLGRSGSPVPSNARQWRALFSEAAAKSARHGRKLLLVVDGLDDDVAWSGVAAEGGTPPQSGADATQSGASAWTGDTPARGSIAALLPSRPPPGMRVIVSLRRRVRLPDDVPPLRHPLRRSRNLRTLRPVPGVPLIRQPPPDGTALGEPVAGLLAVAGGGLRTTDLAELTGLPAERLDRLAQGPAGRALVTDDPVSRTYALADSRLVHAVRENLGEAGILRHTHELLAWSRRWHAAGWPDGTPPYPLAHQLRLLTDTAERAAYVLDLPRLRRLARTAGPDAALAQLEDFEAEIEAEINGAVDAMSFGDGLATLVPLCAARSLLGQDTREVPAGAASLFVRLGDAERARGLARSAPTAVARAVCLADAAVEMAYGEQSSAGQGGLSVDSVVQEAVEWLVRDRAHQGFPGTFRDPESHARLLGAARTLATLNGPGAARPLLRAVLQDPAAGSQALIEAAGMLDSVRDLDAVAVLHDRAETLSAGGMRARTAAVDLWGALARATPSLGPYAGERIESLCEELGAADGLGAVDVLATAASALIALPAKRRHSAPELMRRALARMRKAIEALRDPVSPADSLSADDRAHLRRELAGTLQRLAEAGVMRDDLDSIRDLMEALPEELRVGVLGDPLLERAQWSVEAAEDDRARRDSEAVAAADEKRRAERRAKDAESAVRKAERAAWEAERASREATRTGRIKPQTTQAIPAAQTAQTAHATQTAQAEPEGARKPPPTRHKPTRHRRSAGLPPPGDTMHPDHPDHPHLSLLLEADDELGAGNHLRSRELLETALRNRPAAPSMPANSPPLPGDWTADLCQAMGEAGESDDAEALAQNLPDPRDRARHLAAISLGCSLAGDDGPATRYARAAARLVPDGAAPELANAVAQALAHTGDEAAATAMATGGTAPQRRQALTAVAAGLVRHCPEGAARVAGPLMETLARRIEDGRGGPTTPLPELAALLLAFPDVRRPAPRLSDALHRAARHVADPSMSWPTRSMAVLTLLARLGCLPDEDSGVVASTTDRWLRSLRPGQGASAELALLAAVDGETDAVWCHADAARTPDARSTTLRTAAAHLAGAQAALATDSRADDRVIRTCLALARASGDGSPPDEATARHIALRLLRSDAWICTIPLLPSLAPGALGHLGALAGDLSARQTAPRSTVTEKGAAALITPVNMSPSR
ncbi:hypothetical protein ACFRI7_15005 [Streptomyces sp. NPDC056716]|uniref:hypothetical protein n=1 Tax=unclassified Streptomyces TaxID=2593676 RepID=UPI0036C03A87